MLLKGGTCLSAFSYECNASGALWRAVTVFCIVAMVTCVIYGRIDLVSFVARIARSRFAFTVWQQTAVRSYRISIRLKQVACVFYTRENKNINDTSVWTLPWSCNRGWGYGPAKWVTTQRHKKSALTCLKAEAIICTVMTRHKASDILGCFVKVNIVLQVNYFYVLRLNFSCSCLVGLLPIGVLYPKVFFSLSWSKFAIN